MSIVFVLKTLENFQKYSINCSCKYYCMRLDDGHMTETCCDNNIRGGEEKLLC
jgi:hypothetical protein